MLIKGKLRFISLFEPIEVGDVDIREPLFNFFEKVNGEKMTMDHAMNLIVIRKDKQSEYTLRFVRTDTELGIHLVKPTGFSNIGAYLPDMLERLNGMKIIVKIVKTRISFEPDLTETPAPYEIKYTHSNSCKVPDDKVKSLCKVGETDCCIFLCAGANGFSCEKFNSFISRTILDRFNKGTMRASRIGNCKIVGRIKETPDTKIEQ